MISIVNVCELRDIYVDGVLDYYLAQKINFDLFISIFKRSANCASFFTKQRGRNYEFYTDYSMKKEYTSFNNFIHKKNNIYFHTYK